MPESGHFSHTYLLNITGVRRTPEVILAKGLFSTSTLGWVLMKAASDTTPCSHEMLNLFRLQFRFNFDTKVNKPTEMEPHTTQYTYVYTVSTLSQRQ